MGWAAAVWCLQLLRARSVRGGVTPFRAQRVARALHGRGAQTLAEVLAYTNLGAASGGGLSRDDVRAGGGARG